MKQQPSKQDLCNAVRTHCDFLFLLKKRPVRLCSTALLLAAVFCIAGQLQVYSGETASDASHSSAPPSEQLSISIGYWEIDQISTSDPDPMLQEIENQFAISIEPVSVSWTNYKEYYQMLGATGSLPDVFSTVTISSNDANDSALLEQMITSGQIRALPDDLSDYPNLKQQLEALDYTRYSDGHYYAIPRLSFMDSSLASSDAAMLVRRDWMEVLGYEDPQNLEEFMELIAAFANEDPDGNGLDDTIGYNVNNVIALGKWVMLGITPECNVYSWVEEDGQYVPSWYTDAFLDVVSAYRIMYETGGLDPDFYSKNPSEVLEDFACNRLGALEFKSSPVAIHQLKQYWDSYNDQPFEKCVDVLPIFAASDGNRYSNSSSPFWSESYISASVDDEKLDRILSLYDYLLSDEGMDMCSYGLFGVDYTYDENGSYQCLLELTDEENLNSILLKRYPSLALFSGIAASGGRTADFEVSEINCLRYSRIAMELANQDLRFNQEHTIQLDRPWAFLLYPKTASEEFTTSNVFKRFVKCIIGTEDCLTMWEQVLSDLKEQGIDDYIAKQNQVYQTSLTASHP